MIEKDPYEQEVERLARLMALSCHPGLTPDTLVFDSEPVHIYGTRAKTMAGVHQYPLWYLFVQAANVAVAEYRPDLAMAAHAAAAVASFEQRDAVTGRRA